MEAKKTKQGFAKFEVRICDNGYVLYLDQTMHNNFSIDGMYVFNTLEDLTNFILSLRNEK